MVGPHSYNASITRESIGLSRHAKKRFFDESTKDALGRLKAILRIQSRLAGCTRPTNLKSF
jgi:hypothetical protein